MRVRVLAWSCALACLLAPLSTAAGAAQAEGARVLTPEDVARLRAVGEVAIAPDGATIAYTVVVPRIPGRDEDGPAWVELHAVAFDGSERRPLVTGRVSVSHVRWTPDGTHVSFLARREGDRARSLYVVPARGGAPAKLVEFDTDIQAFDWRPDGRALAFVAEEPAAGGLRELRAKGFDARVYEEDVPARRVYVAELPDGPAGRAERVRALEGVPGHPYEVAWSPDGARLLVDPAPTPLIDDFYLGRRLRVVDAATGAVEAEIENPGKLGRFRWSPDGKWIAVVSAADPHDPREGRLLAVPASGGPLRDLLPGLEGHVEDFAFAPGGELVYLASVGTRSRLGRVRLDGSGARVTYEGARPLVTAFDLDRTGRRLALRAESDAFPPELFALRLDGRAEPARRTELNPWLRDARLGRQEVVRWRAADGLELEGVLIHPVQPAGPAPTIVVAHGGPESHYADGWLTSYALPGQVAAGRGYAVFYPNYRGSTGRGVAFSKRNQGDPVGAEFDDVIAGVDHLVAAGVADRDRVGITGGSYGGFFTAWGATRHSERFAAGVMFVGISNLLSFQGTTEIPREMEQVHFRKNAYRDRDFLLERSPITHAAKARTPLLILAGAEDTRVDPGQSMELYRALRFYGVPTRLVLYPGEGHGNRRAASRYDYHLRMLRWFDWFLKERREGLPPWRLEIPPVPAADGTDRTGGR